jgi:hypothetical protein
LPSSTEIFDLPFFNEGGKKDTELIFDFGSSSESPLVVRAAGSASAEASSSSFVGSTDAGAITGLAVLNTSPGPFPPPRTRSGAGATGTFCLGAGNIESNDDLPLPPPPESKRGFFAAGLSSLSSSSLSPGREGNPMVIFFGPRFNFGAGRDRPVELGLEGGGSDRDDFLDCCGGGGGMGEGSVSLSLSLP